MAAYLEACTMVANFPGPQLVQSGGQAAMLTNDRGAGSRIATVQVQLNDGTLETKEIIVGLSSRVSAEVISGLQAGESVVSGVIQGNVNGIDRDQLRSALGIPGGRR